MRAPPREARLRHTCWTGSPRPGRSRRHRRAAARPAAATTSLPESLNTAKNWDYRYSWIRDTAFALAALLRFGAREETHAAMAWLLRLLRERGHPVGVMHTLTGEDPPDEHENDVPGWRGSRPCARSC